MKYLNKVNPEKHRLIKASLYAMALFGYVHFTSSLISTVRARHISYLNPYHLINVDRFMGGLASNPLVFVFGWLFFLGLLGAIYWLLKPANQK